MYVLAKYQENIGEKGRNNQLIVVHPLHVGERALVTALYSFTATSWIVISSSLQHGSLRLLETSFQLDL